MNFQAVLFDCDGVLVDSEAITCGVLRDMFEEQGWRMSLQECMQRFVGHTVKSQRALIEANTGVSLTDEWLHQFFERRNVQLEQRISAIDGVHDAVQQFSEQCDGRIAVASGADRYKVEMMLRKVGLYYFFAGRIFSGHEMPRSKPYPDVYLAAYCLVVEDTSVGVAAGVAAGATVWGYVPAGAKPDLLYEAGVARVFEHMSSLRA